MTGEVINFQEYVDRKKRENLSEGFQECWSVLENCKNPMSYGEICVLCNKCGRFGEETGR